MEGHAERQILRRSVQDELAIARGSLSHAVQRVGVVGHHITFAMPTVKSARLKPLSGFHALISPVFCAASSWMRR
jgi:hypothetical protein